MSKKLSFQDDTKIANVFQTCISTRNSKPVLEAIEDGIVTGDTIYNKLSLLHVACAHGRSTIVSVLLEKGCDVNRVAAELTLTPLHMAASKGEPSIVYNLIKYGADVNCEDKNKMSPLHLAISNNRLHAAEILIRSGADIFKKCKTTSTPVLLAGTSINCAAYLQMSCKQQFHQFATCTLEHYKIHIQSSKGVDHLTNTLDENGNTLLILATMNALENDPERELGVTVWYSFIGDLLELGSDITICNNNKKNVFYYLQKASSKHYKLVELFCKHCFCDKTKRLNLKNLQLRILTPNIIKCIIELQAKIIDLSGNFLDKISEDLSLCSFIERIKLTNNPLKLIPPEFKTSWIKLQKYLYSIHQRSSRWKERKLIFIGEEDVGKTNLIKCFLTRKNKASGCDIHVSDTINVYQDISLESGQVKDASSALDKPLLVNAWDLGSKQVYYSSHQFFLSSHSTYIIVFDMTDLEKSRIEYWLRSLKPLSNSSRPHNLPPASIYLVGTHIDNDICTEEYIKEKMEYLEQTFRKNIYRNLSGVYVVSSKTGQGISILKEKLFEDLTQKTIGIPTSWVWLSDYIKERQKQLQWVGWKAYIKWVKECSIPVTDTIQATKFLCDYGSLILHESKANIDKSIVILDPEWLTNIMKCVTSLNWLKSSILQDHQISKIFNSYPQTLHNSLIELLENFKIIYRSKALKGFIIPSLLDSSVDTKSLNIKWEPLCNSNYIEIGRLIRFPFLPIGFFDRLIAHALHVPVIRIQLLWRYGLVLSLVQRSNSKPCIGLVTFNEHTHELNIRVRYLKPNNTGKIDKHFISPPALLLRILLSAVDTFVNGYNISDSLQRYIICPHCIELCNEHPFLFSFYEVIKAVNDNQSFIFCEHINSPSRCVNICNAAPDVTMKDMLEIEPSDVYIDKKIGKGGFGTVFSGTLKLLNGSTIDVAIKEIILKGNEELDTTTCFLEFQREVFLMSDFEHPNLVKYFGITLQPLRMVLELVKEGDLFHFLHPDKKEIKPGQFITCGQISKDKFPWNLRLLIALDIAKGMRYLQEKIPPIIHRDLRSPNIFLKSLSENPLDVRAKVADFGMSRASAIGLSGALPTWQWLAPEVLEGKEGSVYTELSDNYSFGIICWEIATRSYPFSEYENRKEFINPRAKTDMIEPLLIKPYIINEDLRPSMPDKDEGAPEEFLTIIKNCLKKDPEERPSFNSIVKDLMNLLNIPIVDNKSSFSSNWRKSKKFTPDRKIVPIIRTPELKLNTNNTNFIEVFTKGNILYQESDLNRAITSLNIYKNRVIIGHSTGLIVLCTINKTQKILWRNTKKKICDIIYIEETFSFWHSDIDGTITIWEPPPINEQELPTLIKTFPFNDNIINTFTSVKMCLVINESSDQSNSSTFTSSNNTVWIYCDPNLTQSIEIYSIDSDHIHSIIFPQHISNIIQYKNGIWITSGDTIYIYNPKTYENQVEWKAHEDNITSIACIDEYIWTGDSNGIINMWHSTNGEEIRKYNSSLLHSGNYIRNITAHDKYIITTCGRFIVIWDYVKCIPLQEIEFDLLPFQTYFHNENLVSCTPVNIQEWTFKTKEYFRKAYPISPSPKRREAPKRVLRAKTHDGQLLGTYRSPKETSSEHIPYRNKLSKPKRRPPPERKTPSWKSSSCDTKTKPRRSQTFVTSRITLNEPGQRPATFHESSQYDKINEED